VIIVTAADHDLTFDVGSARFNFRTAAVTMHAGRVLLHREVEADWWFMPGGRVRFGESSGDALRRELGEELGVDTTIERLLWIVESFFTHEGRSYHELAHFYLVSLRSESEAATREEFDAYDGGILQRFRWFGIDAVRDVKLYPSFLREGLGALPSAPELIVHRDED